MKNSWSTMLEEVSLSIHLLLVSFVLMSPMGVQFWKARDTFFSCEMWAQFLRLRILAAEQVVRTW
jgi:hypothetical protein